MHLGFMILCEWVRCRERCCWPAGVPANRPPCMGMRECYQKTWPWCLKEIFIAHIDALVVLNKPVSHISFVNKLHYRYAWLIGSLLISSALDFKASCLILHVILPGSQGETAACSGSCSLLGMLLCMCGSFLRNSGTSSIILTFEQEKWLKPGTTSSSTRLAERRIGNPRTRYSTDCACQAMQDIGGSWECWLPVFGIALYQSMWYNVNQTSCLKGNVLFPPLPPCLHSKIRKIPWKIQWVQNAQSHPRKQRCSSFSVSGQQAEVALGMV